MARTEIRGKYETIQYFHVLAYSLDILWGFLGLIWWYLKATHLCASMYSGDSGSRRLQCCKGSCLFACLSTTPWRLKGSGGIAPHILNLSTGWRWVVSFIPWQVYPQGRSLWYLLDRKLGVSQIWFQHGDEEKRFISVHLLRLETPVV
jgi:hypothetical protein